MIVEIISTGSELLLGHILNSNVKWLSEQCNTLGYTVAYHTTVGDNLERMTDVLQVAKNRAQLIICTGGLGATEGDITRQALANAIGVPLVYHEGAAAEVDGYYARQGRVKPYESDRDRYLPEGATVLHNPIGVAPAVVFDEGHSTFILLPGPPSEMKGTFTDSVMPFLKDAHGSLGVIYSERYGAYGYREMELQSLLDELITSQSNPTIALLIKPGYIEIRLTAKGNNESECQALLAPWRTYVEDKVTHVRPLEKPIAQEVHELARTYGVTLGTAESCTGGSIGKALTDLPGSSAYYKGGIICYANEVKEKVLGVPKKVLDTVGAVSEETAHAMVLGVKEVLGTDYVIATTGIAGPDGGSATKPVGLVYIGIGTPDGVVVHKELFIGDRESIRASAVEKSLHYIYTELIERKHYGKG